MSSRTDAADASKVTSKTTAGNARSSLAPSTPHSQPVRLLRQGKSAVDSTGPTREHNKTRLSTIAASPVAESSEVNEAPILTRPALGSRKSTTSVTMEQRLREMELVNQMLRAAMAEDGDEDDEAKEEYGKKMDETLADLRLELEEARKNEGKPPLEPSSKGVSSPEVDEVQAPATSLTTKRVEELELALATSREQAVKMERELSSMRNKVEDFDKAADTPSEDMEQAMENIHREHALKIDELTAHHIGELDALRSKLAGVESQHQEHAKKLVQDLEAAQRADADHGRQINRLLEDQDVTHKDALRALETKYAGQRSGDLAKNSQIASLNSEISSLKSQLQEKQAQAAKVLDDKTRTVQECAEKYHDLQTELQDTINAQSHKSEKVEAAVSQRISSLESDFSASQERVRALESANEIETGQRHELIGRKDSEISSLGQVIESLQDELQQLHQTKEREVDTHKVRLIQEHETALSKLRAEHELALMKAQDETTEHATVVEQLQVELQGSHESKARELDESKIKLIQEHESVLSQVRGEYEQKLQDSQNEARNRAFATATENDEAIEKSRAELDSMREKHDKTIAELDALRNQMRDIDANIESERITTGQAKSALEKSLTEASNEILSLKKVLETFDSDDHNKDEQHLSAINALKGDLERTSILLQEKNDESSSVLGKHAAELETLQVNHARDLEASRKDVDERTGSLDTIKSEHTALLETTRENHARELEELRESLERDHSEAKREMEANIAETSKSDAAELQKQHDEMLATTVQQHQTSLSELQDQVLQLRNGLGQAEHELQDTRESQASTERSLKDKYEKSVEGLRIELAEVKADLAQAHETSELLKEKEIQIDTLKQEHVTHVEKLHATIVKDKEIIGQLTAAAEEANRLMLDTSEVDRLKAEVADLITKHAADVAKLQDNMAIEAEKREKERKQGAEVRDRLAAEIGELESFRKDFPAAKEMAAQRLREAEAAKKEMQGLQVKLSGALRSVEEHEARHGKVSVELKDLRSKLAQAEDTRKAMENKAVEHEQAVEALQTIADSERSHNDKLKIQLKELAATAESHAVRVREVEAALKVTSAELTEMQTKRGIVPAKGSLDASQRASGSSKSGVDEDSERANEDMGASIEGTVRMPVFFLSSLFSIMDCDRSACSLNGIHS